MRQRIVTLFAVLALTLLASPTQPAEAAASVTAVLPSSGSASGGYNVTILGSGFFPSSTVYFGGVPAASISWLDSGFISVPVPPGTGTVLVTVVNPDGTTSAGQPFTYTASTSTALAVSSVTPGVGAIAGGTTITIIGSGFQSGVSVVIGGIPATNVSLLSSTLITATAPAGPYGTAPVVVTNPGGQSVVYTAFSYGTASTAAVSISSVSPTSAPLGGGTTVLITGSGFLSGAKVSFGGIAALNPTVYSPTLIGVVAPAGPTGNAPILVTNVTGEAAVYTGFSYGSAGATTTSGQPSVLSVSPNTGSSAGGTTVTIAGSGFTAPPTVTFGGVPASNVSLVSSSLITATTPPNVVGPVTILVGGSGGQIGGLTAGFTYVVAVPLVSGISPASGLLQGGTPITISGSGFVPGATVTVGGVAATGVTVVSPTQITATTPAGLEGSAIVLVINPGGAISGLASAFSYSSTAPTASPVSVTSVTPSTGSLAGGTSVTISGSGFASGASVTIGGAIATATVLSSTQIIATIPANSAAGAVPVTVSNAGGASATLHSGFVYTTGTTTTPPPTGGETPTTPAVPVGGSGLFVFKGGSNADLVAVSGCNASTAVFWTTDAQGTWVGYLPSVPIAIVNQAWNTLFPNGIPANTPIFARCG